MTEITNSRPPRLENPPTWALARIPSGAEFAFEIRTPKHTFRNDLFGVVARVQFKTDADLIMQAVKRHSTLIAQLEKAKAYLIDVLNEDTSKGEMAEMVMAIENTIIDAGGN